LRGNLANISQGAIHIKVSQFLPAKPVRVWFSEDCHKDGQVIFCQPENNLYCVGITFPPDPQSLNRSELRVPLTNQPAIVSQLEGRTDAKFDAQAVDISRSGLGLLLDQRLPVNTWVKVELAFAIAFGEVQYSKPDPDGGYRVGLHMETLLMRDGRLGQVADLLGAISSPRELAV
ncbi:MAG TPA: PilZ domain-containing protein, partial [Bryobacteraceae bacterium]